MNVTVVFLKLLNMSVNASYVIVFVLALRLLLKKVPKKYLCMLWAIVLLRLLCPWSLESAVSLLPSAEPIPENIMMTAKPQIDSGIRVIDEGINPILEKNLSPKPIAAGNPMQTAAFTAAIVWCAGILGMVFYTLWILGRFYLQMREAVPDRTPGLKEHIYRGNVKTPLVAGIWNPKIYLPFELKEPELSSVLLHERIHIRRKDHWFKLLFYAALMLHWFNPLVWAAYRLLERDMEMACDEAALSKLGPERRSQYCEALLNLAAQKSCFAGNPVAFGESDVKMRVKNLLNYKKPHFWVALVMIAIIAGTAVLCLSSPVKQSREQPKQELSSELKVKEDQPSIDDLKVNEEQEPAGDIETVEVEGITEEYYELQYVSKHGFSIWYPENILEPKELEGHDGFVTPGENPLVSVVLVPMDALEAEDSLLVSGFEIFGEYGNVSESDIETMETNEGNTIEKVEVVLDDMAEVFYLVKSSRQALLVTASMPIEALEGMGVRIDAMVQTIGFPKG